MLKLGIHKTFKGKRLYEEVWRTVIEGPIRIYQVSNKGRVKTLNRKGDKKEKLLKIMKDTKGYCYISTCKNNKFRKYSVHRLVAMAFIPNPFNKPCVDHINRVTTDNRVQNLRWVTHKENSNNELTLKHKSNVYKGRKISEEHKEKLKETSKNRRKVMCIETGIIYSSINEAARNTNVNSGTICKCCKGIKKSGGGFHWAYI